MYISCFSYTCRCSNSTTTGLPVPPDYDNINIYFINICRQRKMDIVEAKHALSLLQNENKNSGVHESRKV